MNRGWCPRLLSFFHVGDALTSPDRNLSLSLPAGIANFSPAQDWSKHSRINLLTRTQFCWEPARNVRLARDLFLSLHRCETASVKFEQVRGVLLGLVCASTLKSHSRRSRPAITRSHGRKFHQIERNIFVAARAD